jgi:aminopeptidase N
MTKRNALILGTILILAGGAFAQTAAPAAPQALVDWTKKPLQSERTQTYDALHYLIKLAVDMDQKSFGGETTVTVASLRDGLKDIVLDAEEFRVASVRSDYGDPLTFSQSETELTVNLAAPAKLGERVTFTVAYAGRDPKIGLRFVDATPDNPKIVFSDSFPVNVHHWFPCYDYPNDKVTNELVVTVKAGNKVGANGRLVGVTEDKAAGTVTWHWSQDLPHSTYLIFFAAAPYVVVKDMFGTLPVNYWVYPQDEAKALPTYGKTPKMIAFFNKTYGYDYPWQKYDQISVPSGGGAESTSATAMTHRIMVGPADAADFPAIGIVSHELAHQWWGDLITLRSWAHTWLNESFGTYSDYLYHRYEMGEDEGALNLANKLAAYLREAKTRYIRPIVSDRYEKPGDMFDSHTYPKGARVIHMLRSILGDEAFFKTIRAFLHRFAFQPAETSDFIRTVKDATGRNLDWFFDQWLFKPGHPVFDIGAQWVPSRKVVQMTVAQIQDFSRGVPVYRVPVAVKIVTAQGAATTTVWLKDKRESFEFPAETKPLLVRFDEGNILIKEVSFPRDLDELLYKLKSDDVIGRMDAAAELLKFKDEARVVPALAASVKADPFWAVRRAALESLAKLAGAGAAPALTQACRDEDANVRTAAVLALGDLKDRGRIEFFKELFNKDASLKVRTEAVRSLGKTGEASLVPFLKQAAEIPSRQNMIKRAAEAGLKMLENK